MGDLHGRAVLVADDRALDVERAGEGRFGPAVQPLLEQWEAFAGWACDQDASAVTRSTPPVSARRCRGHHRCSPSG